MSNCAQQWCHHSNLLIPLKYSEMLFRQSLYSSHWHIDIHCHFTSFFFVFSSPDRLCNFYVLSWRWNAQKTYCSEWLFLSLKKEKKRILDFLLCLQDLAYAKCMYNDQINVYLMTKFRYTKWCMIKTNWYMSFWSRCEKRV